VRRPPAPATAAGPARSPLEAELLARFAAWALEPPRPKEVPVAVGKPEPAVRAALDKLLAERGLVKVKPDLYVDAGALDALKTKLLAYLAAHREITPQAWKDLTGTSRKYSIPLAEYFDGEKVTLRIGDLRRKR
jgi:selenocysteine-specific elongation factor